MAQRSNHYDFAFEEFLRDARVPYVVVDEQRRALLREASLKSMDFIVYSPGQRNLLIDVKGRRFPSGGNGNLHKWENWATEDDLSSLLAWESVFGPDFRSMLVFAYDIAHSRYFAEFDALFTCRNRTYAFYGVWVDEYRDQMRSRSPSWDTVSVTSSEFRRLRTPITHFLATEPTEPCLQVSP
jgi:hypothetical protein